MKTIDENLYANHTQQHHRHPINLNNFNNYSCKNINSSSTYNENQRQFLYNSKSGAVKKQLLNSSNTMSQDFKV